MKYLYDVCSDYSLCDGVTEKSIAEAKTRGYKWVDGNGIKLGYHIKTNELHYVKSNNPNLKGGYV